LVDEVLVALGSVVGVAHSVQAMWSVVVAGADVQSQAGESTSGDARRLTVVWRRDGAEELARGEHVVLVEVSSVQSLIPPHHRSVETTLLAQDILEGPEVVSVPDQELWVSVDVGHIQLMKSDQILVTVPCWLEVSGRGLVQQTLDGSDESDTITS